MSDVNHHYTKTLYRHGAEAARRAQNPEDTRSKRVAGIIHHLHRCFEALAQFIKQSNDIVRLSDAINRVGMDSLKYVKYSMQVVSIILKVCIICFQEKLGYYPLWMGTIYLRFTVLMRHLSG